MTKLQFFEKDNSFKTAKEEFGPLLKNNQALTLLRISLLIIIALWIFLAISYQFLPPILPLFFSKPWGEEQLVAKYFLGLIPLAVTILFIINIRIASLTIEKEKLLAFIVLLTQTVIGIISFITLTRIILLLA